MGGSKDCTRETDLGFINIPVITKFMKNMKIPGFCRLQNKEKSETDDQETAKFKGQRVEGHVHKS